MRFIPDLSSELIPGKAAAGFSIGESFSGVANKIGKVDWFEPEAQIRNVLLDSSAWIGVKRRIGFGEDFVLSYRYMNEMVSLYFEDSEVLYRIAVGKGYQGTFQDVGIGSDVRLLESEFGIIFNDADDDFLIEKDGEIIIGISFVTDYRASLENAPEQFIQFISIHDWSLR